MAMALLVALQVFCRYVLNNSLFWSEELARIFLVWLSFLGATVAYYRGQHPGLDLLTSHLPQHFKWTSAVVVQLVSMLLFAVITVGGTQFAWFVRMQISSALNIPKWLILSIVPLSGTLLFFYAFVALIQLVGAKHSDG
ncbi:MAG: C4-dicarboxylate ABC transporter permease [Deltaproteobacteria bacterium]|nr:MAG: C4-dicarboxylate ABC transporter permease [Deltaproteobacteria bacterium]